MSASKRAARNQRLKSEPVATAVLSPTPTAPPLAPVLTDAPAIRAMSPILALPGASTSQVVGGHDTGVTHRHTAAADPLSDAVANLVALHRSRMSFVTIKVKIELQIKALQRQVHARTGCERATHATCPGVYKTTNPDIEFLRSTALAPLEAQVEIRLKAMLDELKALPAAVLAFTDGARGFGRPSLAQIVAEAGALTQYANPAKLWSRMGLGLAPDGNSRYEGRSPRRRSIMHVIGDNFVKAGGPYRGLYDARKAFEQTKPACMKALKKKDGTAAGVCLDKRLGCCKPGHIHNKTLRYVEKRLLLDLWRVWNQNAGDGPARVPVSPTRDLLAPSSAPATEGAAA